MTKNLLKNIALCGLIFFSLGMVKAEREHSALPSIIQYVLSDSVKEEKSPLELVLEAYQDPLSEHIFVAAHRGGKQFDDQEMVPGNSIANIENAVGKGFDLYESDIEILGDDTLIVFHDDHFNNLTNTNVPNDFLDNADIAYAKSLLLTYDNGGVSSERIPTLLEFLTAAKDKIMIKFDLKSGTFGTSTLIEIFDMVETTQTTEQVLIRGGANLLNVADTNGYDTRIIMRRYDSMPSVQAITDLVDNYDVRAISIPNGVGPDVLTAANAAGLIVEIHELDEFTDTDRQNAINDGVRQFHSFKPSTLLEYLEQNGFREF